MDDLKSEVILLEGTEVFIYSAKEAEEARIVLNNIEALGYTNRGIS